MPKRGYADVVDPTKIPLQEKIGRNKEKLAESDRRNLAEQVRQDEAAIEAAKSQEGQLRTASVDISHTKTRMERNKMILQRDDDLTPKSDNAKNHLYGRLKEIEAAIVPKMPTKREMWPKTGSAEAQQAVRHNIKFQEQYADQCKEWQDIKKKLEPDDPYAQSLELIRPD